VLGVDLTKVTILAGAFTVGVGFGLQTVINNFVCGLMFGPNYHRLTAIKKKYDPKNFFCRNQSIKPEV